MSAKILVVDDDASIVHLLHEDLEAEGYQVLEGFDGQMALQIARAQRPNLIIMDVNMPMLSGLKALEYLREADETSEIPILFLTGEASLGVAPTLTSAPRVAHLKKPIDLEHLNSIVRDFLKKYPTD